MSMVWKAFQGLQVSGHAEMMSLKQKVEENLFLTPSTLGDPKTKHSNTGYIQLLLDKLSFCNIMAQAFKFWTICLISSVHFDYRSRNQMVESHSDGIFLPLYFWTGNKNAQSHQELYSSLVHSAQFASHPVFKYSLPAENYYVFENQTSPVFGSLL